MGWSTWEKLSWGGGSLATVWWIWREISLGILSEGRRCEAVLQLLALVGVLWLVEFPHRRDTTCRRLNVVVTGSTRGLGLSLAIKFLRLRDNVIITGRNIKTVNAVVKELSSEFVNCSVFGFACDVSNPEDLRRLSEFASSNLRSVDIWVNNAGVTQEMKMPLAETETKTIEQIVATNLIGILVGCKVAISLMLKHGGGHIFNVDGAGSNGMATPKFATYGATKAALPQLMSSLVKETKGTKVGIHTISPGMVITDLLLSGNREPRALKIFNILCEQPDTVAEWLVPRMRGVKGTGKYIRYLTKLEVLFRFITFFWRRNRFFYVD